MNWDCKTWPPRYRFIFLAVIVILSSIIFSRKGCAEETVGGHIQEAVFHTLSASAVGFAAAEAAVAGNPVLGSVLCSLATREIFCAYDHGKAAWDLYRSYDDPNRNDRDISPAESCMEHGRD